MEVFDGGNAKSPLETNFSNLYAKNSHWRCFEKWWRRKKVYGLSLAKRFGLAAMPYFRI
jgi:hypothetical protein